MSHSYNFGIRHSLAKYHSTAPYYPWAKAQAILQSLWGLPHHLNHSLSLKSSSYKLLKLLSAPRFWVRQRSESLLPLSGPFTWPFSPAPDPTATALTWPVPLREFSLYPVFWLCSTYCKDNSEIMFMFLLSSVYFLKHPMK